MTKAIKAALACALMSCAGLASAEMGMYGRLNLGWVSRSVPAEFEYSWTTTNIYGQEVEHTATLDDTWYHSMFNLMPAFGLMFAPDSDNIFWKGFGAEVQLDLSFGSGVAVINPGVMAKWHYYLPESLPVAVQKIVPYAGLGFSVPIGIVKSDSHYLFSDTSVKAGFDVNINIGCGYELLPKLMLTLDYDLALGTSISNSVRIGAVWRFKGERTIQQVGENEAYKAHEERKKTQAAHNSEL
ncbi:MAG: hypothetical protein K2H09_10345 [Treponemataceae bacterium]|nr:hypothetical protein [Treponemataceae bacterium]